MSVCQLTDTQKDMIRSIVPGLHDGTVQTEWTIVHGGDRIMAIFGLDDDGILWREVWQDIQFSDFDDFAECELFRQRRTDNYGVPTHYSLHKQRIFDLVESNFGDKMEVPQAESEAKDPRAVFVVHGRNEVLRSSLFDFLRAIGLKPLEWSELINKTGQGSPYIGDVLTTAFNEAQAFVVLMTPEDEARLIDKFQNEHDESHEINLTPQPRPNVLFEAGMAMGRYPDRTILVQVGKIRPFSDIAGRHVIRLDNSSAKRHQLAQRLERAGCTVNLAGTDWHHAGHFAID